MSRRPASTSAVRPPAVWMRTASACPTSRNVMRSTESAAATDSRFAATASTHVWPGKERTAPSARSVVHAGATTRLTALRPRPRRIDSGFSRRTMLPN